MTADDKQGLMMGAVVAVLAYALYRHFVPAGAAAKKAPASTAYTAYGEASPYTSMYDYSKGQVVDVGAYEGHNYLADIEAMPAAGGFGPRIGGAPW